MSINTSFPYYIGQVDLFPYTFEPLGWAACDGRLLSVQSYPILFGLIGTTYGGDGVNSFALPNVKSQGLLQPETDRLGFFICLDGCDPTNETTTNYLGQISLFAFSRIPSNMQPCDGQLLQISDYSTMYSLLGTDYGGNGFINFALPHLQPPPGLNGAGQGQYCICINGIYPTAD